jgi:hypothetical protein
MEEGSAIAWNCFLMMAEGGFHVVQAGAVWDKIGKILEVSPPKFAIAKIKET